jgi:8-amino-3,8-dideoxy-alpha-D-manno-octulosonate transaminase
MPGFEYFGDEERQEVHDVLETGVLFRYGFDQARKGHWKAKTFESDLSKRVGSTYCHLCSSGTGALTIALASCGIGAGDEVIIPPFTFVATMEAVLYAGAIPVFADIDQTLCLDPGAVDAAVTPRTKAVIAVHMCGAMARITEIKQVCEQKNLILIEDACQALGASYQQKYAGTYGHVGCFSFDPVKTITCGEGGAIVTDSREIYETGVGFADHGHDHIGNDRGLEGHPILGSNYRISELNAAIGVAQLKKLDRIIETQRANKKIMKEALAQFPDVDFRIIPDESGDSATFLSFLLPDEVRARWIASQLSKAGVDGCFYWFDNNWHYLRNWEHLKGLKSPAPLALSMLHRPPDYQNLQLPKSDSIIVRTISMLIKLSWTETDLARRTENMSRVLKAHL